MKYILSMTKDTDFVYDGANNFNLFRHDLHYFWFQTTTGLENYNALSGNRFGDYDPCSLIKAKKPKFITTLHFDFSACGLDAFYVETKYPGVYIRRESPAKVL